MAYIKSLKPYCKAGIWMKRQTNNGKRMLGSRTDCAGDFVVPWQPLLTCCLGVDE
jgi:hypothetical protein